MSQSPFPRSQDPLKALFTLSKPVIGVVHSLPLPGSPWYQGQSMEEIYEYALTEARRYAAGGVDGLMVENARDLPFLKPDEIGYETVATMSVMTQLVRSELSVPVGVSCLADGVVPALAIAKASGAAFVRATQWVNAYIGNQGFVDARAPQATRYRASIGAADVHVLVDVHVKHGSHAIVGDRSVKEQAQDAEYYAADALIATGSRTGAATPIEEVRDVKSSSSLPVLVGSGANVDNIEALLREADGVIVGSSLKQDGAWWNPVDVDKVRRFMDRVRQARQAESKP